MKKLLAAVLIASAFLSQSSTAQTIAAPDPAAVKAANDMLESMHYRDMTQTMFSQMRQNMPLMFKRSAAADIMANKEMDAAGKQAAMYQLDAEAQKSAQEMERVFNDPAVLDAVLQNAATLFARHFSADELHQMTAFYRTPVGAKMLTSMPQMMAESMEMTQKVIMPRLAAAMKRPLTAH